MLDQDVIRSIANESNTSKAVFDTLSKRIRFRRQTNLSKFANLMINKGERIVEEEYIQLFKRLEEAGIGTLVIGRRGKPNRFKWNYNLKDIGRIGMGEIGTKDLSSFDSPIIKPSSPAIHTPKPTTITLNLNVDEKVAASIMALLKK